MGHGEELVSESVAFLFDTGIKQEKPSHHDLAFPTNQQNLTFIKNENIV